MSSVVCASVPSMKHPAVTRVRQAADELQTALFLGDGVNVRRQDLDGFAADALDRARRLLAEAENCFVEAPQGSSSGVAEAMRWVREASDAIESTRGLVRWMPQEVVYARADALRILDGLTGRL